MGERFPAFVVGRQIFTDLWSLAGFSSIPCESPEELGMVLARLHQEKAAFVIVEESWFGGVQENLRKRLEKSGELVWIQFPPCDGGEME